MSIEPKVITKNKVNYITHTIRTPLDSNNKDFSYSLHNLVSEMTLVSTNNNDLKNKNPYLLTYFLGSKSIKSIIPYLFGFSYLFYRRQRVLKGHSYAKSFFYTFFIFTSLMFVVNATIAIPNEEAYRIYTKEAILNSDNDDKTKEFQAFIQKQSI